VTRATGHTGAVTLVQHFGWTLKLNVHLHMVFVDGVSVTGAAGRPVLQAVPVQGEGARYGVSGTTGGATQPDQNAGSPQRSGRNSSRLSSTSAAPSILSRPTSGPGIATTAMPAATAALTPAGECPRLAVGRGEEFLQQLVAFREEHLRGDRQVECGYHVARRIHRRPAHDARFQRRAEDLAVAADNFSHRNGVQTFGVEQQPVHVENDATNPCRHQQLLPLCIVTRTSQRRGRASS